MSLLVLFRVEVICIFCAFAAVLVAQKPVEMSGGRLTVVIHQFAMDLKDMFKKIGFFY